MKKTVEARKDIAFFIKLYPLPMHPEAYEKSKTIVCKKSMTLLEQAFEGKKIPKPECNTTAIDENRKLAEKLGIRGTPAIIFPDGSVVPGYVPSEAIIEIVDSMGKK